MTNPVQTSDPTCELPTVSVLIDEEAIARRVNALASEISADYAGQGELVMIGVLKGAYIFLSDLSRRMTIDRRTDFIAVSSYGAGTTSGAVRLLMDLRDSIEDRHVLIVEDILDTGHTLTYLSEMLNARKPASVKTCAFVRKPSRVQVDLELDYLGFDIPDEWVVGYGLDWNERYRTLPYIGSLTFPKGTDQGPNVDS
ncbi:MAG: hypoxanthine phosphoribosyltransferase [Gammaproteobacteria bacterium]|jgi:hypoxanthine phosphoribosyltransferase